MGLSIETYVLAKNYTDSVIDSGAGGVVPNITMTAVQLEADEQPTVTKGGTSVNPTFELGIPKGEQGPQGLQGQQGIQGIAGATGPQGPTGPKGDTGAQGIQGPIGQTGQQGPKGEQGEVGPAGPAGAQGIQGPKGENGTPFLIAKIYATVETMNSGYATDGLQEGELVAIATDTGGEQGGYIYAKGPTQYDFFYDISTTEGIQGPQGEPGVQGPQGPQGAVGPMGPQGPQGEQGPQGLQGEQGPQGPAGANGANGATGPQGPQGEQGVQGEQGIPGQDATINGVNTLNIVQGENITLNQVGNTLTISATGGGGGTSYTTGDGINIQNDTISVKISQQADNATGILNGEIYTPTPVLTNLYPCVEVKFPEQISGVTITVSKGEVFLSEETDENGIASINIPSFGIWNISATLEQVEYVQTLVVDNIRLYKVTLYIKDVYGVLWSGGPESTWSRTDGAELFENPISAIANGNGSSPFDNIMPWSGITRISDSIGGELVAIPKYWYKWTRLGSSMKLQISNREIFGFYTSPAHADRGDGHGERDVVYVGRYHCDSSYKSTTGVIPVTNVGRASARTKISDLGAEYWQYDFAMFWTIAMLYLVEFADWNSQNTIGYGCSPSGSKFNTGLTDAMQYHTGTSAVSRTSYGCCQYRNIEGLWDNVFIWCDGIYFSNEIIYTINNPADYNDESGGVNVGNRTSTNGYISAWTNPVESNFEYALFPNAASGSASTFVCDDYAYASTGTVLRMGGDYDQAVSRGLFCMRGTETASRGYGYVGCRVQKLPN